MIARLRRLAPNFRSLSARLLLLTIVFVMLGEVLIFVPSVARFRLGYLQSRIDSARLATLALEAAPNNIVNQNLANALLLHVGASGIVLRMPDHTSLLIASDMPPAVDMTYDLREADALSLIGNALVALSRSDNRVLRVLGTAPQDPNLVMEVLLVEKP
ncbi:MAG TPA: sensor histidine kinase, partial [Stellaceae bacterium]|nr:sensor histidine kinase [Stellaceae bacterium]